MSKNIINNDDDYNNAVSEMLTTAEVTQFQHSGRRPSTPKPPQRLRSSKYPTELSAQSHHQRQHRYEGFEELLREAGYKETRIYTPERERVTSKNEPFGHGHNDGQRNVKGGNERTETTKLRSMVGFLAGFLVSSNNSEHREEHGEHGLSENPRLNPRHTSSSPPKATQPPSSTSLSTSSPSQSTAASPNIPPPGTPQQTHVEGDISTPTQQSRTNLLYLHGNASYSSIASTSTATQPKYLRSAHIQHKQRQSGGTQPTSPLPSAHYETNPPITRQFSEMLPPPVPPIPRQYRNQNHQASRPTTPSHSHFNRPAGSAQSRPSTPTSHAYARPPSRNHNHDSVLIHAPHLRSVQTEPLPGPSNTVQHPVPSKAHAYLRHMASVQKIFDSADSQASLSTLMDTPESWTREGDREGEEEDTPKPKYTRPKSTPGTALKGLNLWSSFTSTTSAGSQFSSSSSYAASHSTSATSPQTSSSLCNGLVGSPERHQEDEGSEPDEENGGYFNLIRSRSQSRSRRDVRHPHIRIERTVESGEENTGAGARWWGLRQSKSMVHVKVQEEDESLVEVAIRRRKSAIGVSGSGYNNKPMNHSTNLRAPVLLPSRAGSSSPALPYLVTRLSSPAPLDGAEQSRGRVQEKKTRVYCRSQSVPRRRKSGRSRWSLRDSSDQEPVPILVANTSDTDTESVDGRDHDRANSSSSSRERYLTGWGADTGSGDLSPHRHLPSEESSSNTPRSPPPRQNSIRSLRRHLKLDSDVDQQGGEEVPPVPAFASGRSKDRGGLPGGWVVG